MRSDIDSLIRFAVESGKSGEIAVTSLQTRTTVRLPRSDVPLVIAALRNMRSPKTRARKRQSKAR